MRHGELCIVFGDPLVGVFLRSTSWVVRDSFALFLPGPMVVVAWVVRWPLEGTVTETALSHGRGLLNIDSCRIGLSGGTKRSGQIPYPRTVEGKEDRTIWARTGHSTESIDAGRWPSNLLFVHDNACKGDCSPCCPTRLLDGGKASRYYPTFPTLKHAVEWLSCLVGVPDQA